MEIQNATPELPTINARTDVKFDTLLTIVELDEFVVEIVIVVYSVIRVTLPWAIE